MGSERNETNGFFQILALAAFVVPLVFMDSGDPIAWVFLLLGGAAIFSMMLDSHK